MVEAWWLAHKLEFIVGLAFGGIVILGMIIYALIEWIKKCLKGQENG